MSLFSNLYTASSGLNVSSTTMSVIGDNIANVNTIGYKQNRASFSDAFPLTTGTINGPAKIGTGANVAGITSVFAQGAIQSSGNALDMAINGNGFYAVKGGDQTFYSRAGEFFLDDNGFIVTPQGYQLQGYLAEEGAILPSMGSLQIPTTPIPSQNTTNVSLTANLDADADSSTTPVGNMTLDGLNETITEVASASDYSTSVTVYDSLGNAHELTIAFEKDATNTWSYYVLADAGSIDDPNGLGYSSGNAFAISSGSVTFNNDGSINSFTQTNTSSQTPWSFAGAAAQDFNFNFGVDANGNVVSGALTQIASASSVTSLEQDGYGLGQMVGLKVLTDGTITGTYDNGQEMVLGQVALASFKSENGLERLGGNLFRATFLSGEPAMGAPGSGGRGGVFGNALESSNVDIEDQFVTMITAQRSYQANSRVLSSTNELLRELVNLV
ncbi:MAG: flagellar hook protein FlgE [Myxococcota bacterium]